MKESGILKKGLAVVIVLNLGALIAFGYLLYEIRSKIKATDELSYKISIERNQNDIISEAKKSLKEVEEKVVVLDGYILNESDFPAFLTSLEKIAKDLNIVYKNEIKKVNNSDTKTEKLEITFGIEGEWKNIMTLVALVENLPFEIDISNFNIRASDGSEKKIAPVWKGSLTFSIVTVK